MAFDFSLIRGTPVRPINNTVQIRYAVEYAVVSAVLRELEKAGWRPCRIDCGDGPFIVRTKVAALNELFSCDDGRIYFEKRNCEVRGWIFCVLGNSGWDVISDYSAISDNVIVGGNSFSEAVERVMERADKKGFTVILNK